MRWLMIGFIVSLGALLIAVAGMARHIWLQRRNPANDRAANPIEHADKVDFESEL